MVVSPNRVDEREICIRLAQHIREPAAQIVDGEIVQIPERIVQFRVVWEDDQGRSQVNRGFRVQVSTMSQSSPLLVAY